MQNGVAYYDREGEEISREDYNALMNDQSYARIRDFENDRVIARVEWDGKVTGGRGLFPSERKIFRVVIWEKMTTDEYGNRLPDDLVRLVPSLENEQHATLGSAIAQYEDFLARYTDCEFITNSKGESVLMEVGNQRKPPEPPPPDAPTIDPSASNVDYDTMGSW